MTKGASTHALFQSTQRMRRRMRLRRSGHWQNLQNHVFQFLQAKKAQKTWFRKKTWIEFFASL